MTDIAMCENKDCERSAECFRFTAEASKHRQTYMMNMKEYCEEMGFKYWIPNFKGAQQIGEDS